MPELLFVLFAAFLVIVAIAAWFSWKAERARTVALGELAQRLGFDFDPQTDGGHDDRFAQFEVFRRGHSRVARNTLTGELQLFGVQCGVRCGDFRYRVTSSNGKSRSTTTYRFSYLILHLPWQTPPLLIRPEGVWDKIAAAFGFDDIDFESAEFSRAFMVKATDKRFAYDVLHPRMMEFLLAEVPPMIDIEDGDLCLCDGKKRWTPERFEAQLAFARRFADQWPRHLLQDLHA